MSSNSFFPTTEAEQGVWLTNFALKLPVHGPVCGIGAEEITGTTAEKDGKVTYSRYVLASYIVTSAGLVVPFAGVFFIGVAWKRITTRGVWAGTLTGFVIAVVLMGDRMWTHLYGHAPILPSGAGHSVDTTALHAPPPHTPPRQGLKRSRGGP